jgi:hypothetical protein
MSQPKYSPQEALDRVKLMMKYDTSKTLTENRQIINEIAPLVIAGITITAPWLYAAGASAIAGIGTWIYNVQGGGDAFAKTKTFFEGCSSLDKNLKPLQSKTDHREAADAIYNAIEGIGTDENAIKGAISSMESVSDLCAMYKYYNKTYGDLYDDLDGDLDGESFRRYVWSSIAPIVDDAENDLEKTKKDTEDCKKNPNQEKCKAVTPRKEKKESKFEPCSGTYKIWCKSPKIGEVQACLGGLAVDNAFGPLTAAKLKEKGFGESFTDADVAKICQKKPVEDKPEISGEVTQTKWSDF